MNLKESFRYTKFIDGLASEAMCSLMNRNHAFVATKVHHKSKANPEAEDKTEEIDNGEFYENDLVIAFLQSLIDEKYMIAQRISEAKASLTFNLDAQIEKNRMQRKVADTISAVLRMAQNGRVVSKEMDYKFNAEGNQVPYYYEAETTFEDAFDRAAAKETQKEMMRDADMVSSDVDAAMINTIVSFYPSYDVNGTFEDAIESFIEKMNG